jgi:hypothetical protein
VERGATHPTFREATGEVMQARELGRNNDLERLAVVMLKLKADLGRCPNQTEVIEEAKKAGLPSRVTVLQWLRDGERRYWASTVDGRSKTYDAYCLTVYLSTRLGVVSW